MQPLQNTKMRYVAILRCWYLTVPAAGADRIKQRHGRRLGGASQRVFVTFILFLPIYIDYPGDWVRVSYFAQKFLRS